VSQAKGSARWALVVFGVLAVASVPLYLAFARHEWFFLDEWDFLADRTAWNVGDLLRPHVNHWTTLPIIAWRGLWSVFGLRSYLPYVVLSVLVHVAVAALVRVVMRRAGVDPWIATVVAAVVLFFGAGAENILYAFQITFTGALAFGLAHLLLADHEGPIDRRDWLGVLAGLLGLLCSGVAIAMVAVVGLATLARRGWRVAAFHVAPLAVVYLAWWAKYARSVTDVTGDLGSTVGFVRRGFTIAFGSLGQVVGVGLLIAVVLLAGLWLVRDDVIGARRAQLTAPFALAIGAVLFFVLTGLGRTNAQRLIDDPGASRYQYVAVALLAPVLAVAIDALFRRSLAVGAIALAVLLVGVPGNLSAASDFGRHQARITKPTRDTLLTIARLPREGRSPADLEPDPINAPWVTLGWIRDGVRSGRIPALDHPADAILLASDRLRLSLMQIETPRRASCPALTAPVDRRLRRDDRLRIGNGAVSVRALTRSGAIGIPVPFGNALLGAGPTDHELLAVTGPLRVEVAPIPGRPAYLC
jgi:hypothetical protein